MPHKENVSQQNDTSTPAQPGVYIGGTSTTAPLFPRCGSRIPLSSCTTSLLPEPDVPVPPVASDEKSLTEGDV